MNISDFTRRNTLKLLGLGSSASILSLFDSAANARE